MTTLPGIDRLLLDRLPSSALDESGGIIQAYVYEYRRLPC